MAVDSNVEFSKLSQISTQIEDMLTRQKNVLKGQLDIVNELATALKDGNIEKLEKGKDFSKNLKEISEKLENITEKKEQINLLGYAFERATKKTGLLNKKLRELEKKNLPAATVAVTAMVDGFKSGFGATNNLVKLLGRSLMTVGKTLWSIAKSAITFPFKILNVLIHEASQGGDNELARQLEEIRKQFGYLNKTAGGAIVQMSRSMRGQLANTGLSVYRVFGNLAKRLEYFLEYAKNLGPVFDAVYRHIGEGGAEALGAFNKALGFTAEGQKAIASRAVATGRTVNAINREIANYAIQLSEQFGITMKEVSRDVGNMMADFQHFGHLGVRELTQVATQARRLGIEVKALASLMDKWNNFDEAAEGAARLSQAFGLNVDALKLIQSQNPAERMEQLRKAFFRAGRSVETMTNQERRYLAQQTGLDDATVGLAFSLKNQALSYDQVTKKGAAAQKNQLTQAQALQRLSGAIERLTHAGGGDGLGFFDKFFKGFKIGIRRTHEFRRVMINLRRSLRQTLYAGIQVGRDFVKTFPGIRDYLRGLADLFNPRRFRVLLNSVKDAFHNFFLDMSRKDGTALPRLLDRLKHGFLDFFNRSTPAGQRTLAAFKQYLEAFVGIINGLLKNTLRGLTRIITEVTDVLSGRKNIQSYLSELGSTGGFLGKLFERLTRGLGPVALQLWGALKTLFETVWEKAKPYLVTALKTYFITSISLSLVSAGMQGFIGGVGTRLGLILMRNMFFSSPVQNATKKGAQAAVQNAASAVQQAQQKASRAQQASTDVSGAVAGASRTSEAVQRSRTTGADLAKLALIAVIIGVGILLLVRGMFSVIQEIREKRITPQEIMMAAGVLGASTALVLASTLVIQTLGRMPSDIKNPGKLIGNLINAFSVAGAMLIFGFGLIGGIRKFNFTTDEIQRANLAVLGMSGLILAASASVGIIVAAGSLSRGNPTAVIAGLLGLLGVLGVMIVGVMGILHVTRSFNVQQVENAKKIMDAVGSLFVRASVVLGIATIAGALAAFSGGTSALALAAGMAMITSVVTLMVAQSLAIIQQVNRLNLDSGFEQKLNAFVRVVQAISGFVNPLVSSLTELNPGFFRSTLTRLFGGNPEAELQNIFSSLTGVIQTIGREVSRLLKSVTDSLAGIRSVPEGTISTYATVVGSVASLASALVPQLQNLRTSVSDSIFGDSATMSQKIQELGLFVRMMSTDLMGIIDRIGHQIRLLETMNFTEESLRGARIFVGVLKAVGDLAKSLVPSPEFIRAIGEATFNTRRGGWADAMGRFINQLTSSLITSGLLNHLRDFVQQLGTYFSSFNRTQLHSLEISSRIITPLFGLITSIVDLIRSNSVNQQQPGASSLGALAANLLGFEGQITFVTQLFNTIKEQVPLLLTTIGNIRLNRGQISAIRINLNLVKNLIELTKQAIELTPARTTNTPANNNPVEQLTNSFVNLRVMAGLISNSEFVSSLNGISRININSRAITTNLSSVNRVVTKMGEVSQSLSSIQASMQAAQTIAESMKGNSVRSVTTAIVEMVNTINEVSHEMAKATQNLPNVNVSLRRMADGLGMAGNNSIEIRRRDVVISVPVTVTLKGEELQTTLISVANNTPTGRPRLGVNAGA